jgi:hypothetical protein
MKRAARNVENLKNIEATSKRLLDLVTNLINRIHRIIKDLDLKEESIA